MFEKRQKDLETEHRGLPAEIARLSAEGRNLVEGLGTARGTALRLLNDRIEEVGDQINRCELRLRTVERSLAELAGAEVEAQWVTDTLARFDEVWDVLTVENQARLVEAVVKKVVVDDINGTVSAELADLTSDNAAMLGDGPAGAPPARDVAPQRETEARP